MTYSLKKGFEFHTHINEVIPPIRDEVKHLSWIISNIVINHYDFTISNSINKDLIKRLTNSKDYVVFTGNEFLEVFENTEIQFIWSLFSGMNELILNSKNPELPNIYGNSSIWEKPDDFLVKGAEIEIICIDSSDTMVKFSDKNLEAKLVDYFPSAEKL